MEIGVADRMSSGNIGVRGVARNLFWGYRSFWGWIKLLNSHSDVILPHKKFTWADFGGINTDIHPRRYAPVGARYFCRKLCMKNNKMSEIYVIFARKTIKCRNLYDICPKMPEFYMLIFRKIFFQYFFFGGGGVLISDTP